MMITKETFVKLITMMMNTIDDKREFIEDNDYIPDECKDCIMEECDFQKDLITMLTCIMIDRFGVIRDYLYDRDENGEYFFGMEGNVFTIIGNRMKGRRACWSVNGGNRLAALLCKRYSVNVTSEQRAINDSKYFVPPISAAKAPKKDGKGYEFTRNISIPPNMKWLKNISSCKPFTNLNF